MLHPINLSACTCFHHHDTEVRALVVGTGEALSAYPFGRTPSAFDLAPGAQRKRHRFHPRREGGGKAIRILLLEMRETNTFFKQEGEAAGWTIKWGAWLEQTLDCGVDGSYS